MDTRSAIRNYLLRGQQADANKSNNNFYWSNQRQVLPQAATTASGAQQSSSALHSLQSNGSGHLAAQASATAPLPDESRARTVDIVREASSIITRIMNTTDAVAFDCKGFNLGFDGQITLIQFGFLPDVKLSEVVAERKKLAAENGCDENGGLQQTAKPPKPEVCVFDLITNPELAYCLKPLLESDKIIKIVHDVRNKSNALFVQFKIILNNVFDTQIANLVVQQQETGKPAYKSRYIAMSRLCEIYGNERLVKYRNLIKSKTRHSTGGGSSQTTTSNSQSSRLRDVNYWRTRPLSRAMIYEATMDVYCLVGGIYQNLKFKIKPEYEPLFNQLNVEGVMARIKPEEIRSAKKERKIDLEVIDLKRKLYSDTTNSIVLSNREIRLLRHIDLTPEVRQKIQQCKKVAKKLERLDMKAQGGGANASMLLSQNSQVSEDGDDDDDELASLDVGNTGGSSLLPSASANADDSSCCVEAGGNRTQAAKPISCFDEVEFSETGIMTNLMDSSMFDELKDKMIESSSLLESLEDDDDDDIDGDIISGASSHGQHSSHEGHPDCCRCQCHRGSATENGTSLVSVETAAEDKPTIAATQTSSALNKSTESSASISSFDNSKPAAADNDTSNDQDSGSDSKSAVDMAVQCDLLS